MSERPRVPPIAVDPEHMLEAVVGLPDQLEASWEAHGSIALSGRARRPASVVIAGMGGSAIAGDLAISLFEDRLSRPAVVCRGSALPGWASADTLVIASSHSGYTAETLEAFEDAGRRGCARLAITSGGELAQRAAAAGNPILRLPTGGQPRAAVGHGFAAVLAVLTAAEVMPDPAADLAEAAGAMRRAISSAAAARDLAARLAGRLVVAVAPRRLAPVARRWKTQLNENAKTAAAFDEAPELNHNTIVGLSLPPGVRDLVCLVCLDAPSLPAAERRRLAAAADVAAEAVGVERCRAPRSSLVGEAMWLLMTGDLVSVYAAGLAGIDPTPVEPIRRVKALLAGEAPLPNQSTAGRAG